MAITQKSQETTTTSATTTTILAAPGASDSSRVHPGMITIRNTGGASNTITIQKDISATDYEIEEFTLAAGDQWFNEWEVILEGANDILEVVTSSTSATDFIVNYIEVE